MPQPQEFFLFGEMWSISGLLFFEMFFFGSLVCVLDSSGFLVQTWASLLQGSHWFV